MGLAVWKQLLTDKDGAVGTIVFGGSVFYSIYHVYKISNVINTQIFYNDYYDFDDGWSVIERKRDAADEEWETAKSIFVSLILWIILHIIISELIRKTNFHKFLPIAQSSLSISYVFFKFNFNCLFLVLFQPIVFEIFNPVKKKRVVWTIALLNLIILESFKSNTFIDYLSFLKITEKQHFVLILTVYWINLRCVSYYIDHTEKSNKSNLINSLSYALYLPLLSFGPFIRYEDFCKARKIPQADLKNRLTILFKNIVRYSFWWIFTELFLHFVYVNVISFHPQVVQQFDSVTLYGFGYSMGQFFHLKYVVMYGLSTTIAQFDGIPIPNVPKCIARIHLYSDMWKYFDHGLYKFLLKYIYVPVNNATASPYFSSMICFTFIYIWHGFLRTDIFIWAAFNCFAVCLERMFKTIYNVRLRKLCLKYLNEDWERRAGCLISAPLLMMSAVSNFYFFGGTEIGHIFVHRIFEDKFSSTLTLLFTLYCCGLLSTAIKKMELGWKILNKKMN